MMRLDTFLDKRISKTLLEQNAERDLNHKSSGKLSASMLGWPIQWMILKNIGVPQKPIDEYTLRKFRRGEHVEQWVVENLGECVVKKQEMVHYRNVIGFADAVVDTTGWDFPLGEIPFEVKSVTNAKYRRVSQRKNPDRSHLLQACLYALGLGKEHFGLVYVASDDYRVHVTIHDVATYKDEIDAIITSYDTHMNFNTIPSFVIPSKEDTWMVKDMYCKYPSFIPLAGEVALAEAMKLTGGKITWPKPRKS